MSWKNGGGITSQIKIFPEHAAPAADSFHWRLSTATVSQTGAFSLFKGCDRWLVIIEGDGLVLNGTLLPAFKPFKFSGDIPIHCQIVGVQVIDLGLIFRRDKLAAKMEWIDFSGSEKIYFEPGTHLFYCLNGGLKINGIKAEKGDTVLMEGPFEATLNATGPVSYVYVKLIF